MLITRRDKHNVNELLEKILVREKSISASSKEIVDVASTLSSFDVGMTHISKHLMGFAGEMSLLSDSNLAIVEEATASMTQVNNSIDVTTNVLQDLADKSKELSDKNTENSVLLSDVNNLKEDVVDNTKTMSVKIEQLFNLTNEVGKIVGSVQSIANQTNLLALNAAIEAARAGVHGKGFSVVAEEVRKLADDTKQNLNGMQQLVNDIVKAVGDGKDSMDRTMTSTINMSEKIDVVSETINDNIVMLNNVITNVDNINETMHSIRLSAEEVNQAMESSSKDAQRLSMLSQDIHNETTESVNMSKNISKIDDELSSILKTIFTNLETSDDFISNNELIGFLDKAKLAHSTWIKTLTEIVNKENVLPLQTNPQKCAFGHFYYILNITHPLIAGEWKQIEGIHSKFHLNGDKVIQAIEQKKNAEARSILIETTTLSEQLIKLLSSIEVKINKLTNEGKKVFE